HRLSEVSGRAKPKKRASQRGGSAVPLFLRNLLSKRLTQQQEQNDFRSSNPSDLLPESKKAANQRRRLNGTASQPKGGIMSGLERWKENRIRQEIYWVHLKHTDASPSGGGLNGGKLQTWNGRSVLLLEQTLGTREEGIPNRREKNRLP